MNRLHEFEGGRRGRRGAVLPMVAICLVGLMSFVALAVDVGVMLIARTQCQTAADAAALAGTRELTGDPTTNYNSAAALPAAQNAAVANKVLGTTIASAQVSLALGKYYYNTTTARFVAWPSDTGSVNSATAPYSLIQSTITTTPPTYFAKIFGVSNFNVSATATAVARPRDVAMIIDFSGSMGLDSLMGTPLTNSTGTAIANRTASINNDPNFPQTGPYTNSAGMGLQCSSTYNYQIFSGEIASPGNTTYLTPHGDPAIVGTDLFQDSTPFGNTVPAFTRASASYATAPAGDAPLLSSSGLPVRNVNEIVGDKLWTMKDTYGNDLAYIPASWNWQPESGFNAYPRTGTQYDYGTGNTNNNRTLSCYNGWDARISSSLDGCGLELWDLDGQTFSDSPTINYSAPSPLAGTANYNATPRLMGSQLSVPVFNYKTNALQTMKVYGRAVLTNTNWETNGYGSNFAGYTAGPGFWGKTFFIWPPDPRGPSTPGNVSATNDAKDWRQKFFTMNFTPWGFGAPGYTSTPARPAPVVVSTTGGSSSGSSSSGSSSSTGASSSTGGSTGSTPPVAPTPFTTVTGGCNNNYVLFNGNAWDSTNYGRMQNPGWTTTWPPLVSSTSWDGTAYNSGSTYEQTYSWDFRPFQPSPSGTATFTQPSSVGGYDASTEAMQAGYWGQYGYSINYNAILNWIKNTGPNPFPPRLRAGGILYYSSIPSTISNPGPAMDTSSQANRDMRFWKEYIDFALGWHQNADYSWTDVSDLSGFGPDLSQDPTVTQNTANPFPLRSDGDYRCCIRPKPCTQTIVTRRTESQEYTPNPGGIHSNTVMTLVDSRYMDYRDSPRRPKTRFWFGGMTMWDFIESFNRQQFWSPGTAHEAPMWQLKAGVQTALDEIRNNHPNDFISVIGFSVPISQNSGTGYYNAVRAPLSQNYNQMKNSLFFPQYVIDNNREISTYDVDTVTNASIPGTMNSIPRPVNGTCTPYSLMLAYNQFSDNLNSASQTGASGTSNYGMGGGLGRLGAARLVIFETDGVASATATQVGSESSSTIFNATIGANGSNPSYFKVRYSSTYTSELPNYVYGPASNSVTQSMNITNMITNQTSGYDPFSGVTDATKPGFATTRKAVKIHTIAFGSLFNAQNSGDASQTQALNLLQYMQYRGSVQNSASTPLAASQIINQPVWDDGGTNPLTSRKSALQQAFVNSMQDTVSVVLIR